MASGMPVGEYAWRRRQWCNVAAILQIIGRQRRAALVYPVLLWYWTTILWSIDTCQNKVSADQYRPKIQGLFKDFPGPYLEISRTFLNDNFTSNPNTCKTDMYCEVGAKLRCEKVTRENTENENTGYHIFHEYSRALCFAYLNICFHWIPVTLKP